MPSGAPGHVGTSGGKPHHPPHPAPEVQISRHASQVLSPVDVGRLMIGNGWPKKVNLIATGIAVVDCESGFGATPGGKASPGSDGCNSAGACGPWQEGALGGAAGTNTSRKCATDWACSTKHAYSLYKSRKWQPWVASQSCWSGKDYTSEAQQAIKAGPLGPGGSNPLGDLVNAAGNAVTSPFAALADLVKYIGRLFESSFWIRAGKVILGLIMLVFAMNALSKALLGFDMGDVAESAAGFIGPGKLAKRTGGSRARMSGREAAKRAGAQQAAREHEKTRGQEARKKQFFEGMEEPPF